ncbi:MAG: acyl-CoA synthetase [Gaiella sp.]
MAAEIAHTGTHRQWHPAAYEEMRKAFRWRVPQRYNIAADVLDKHEPSRPAMFWEDWEGNERTLTFGDMQALTNRTANALRACGVGEGDRVAVMLPPLPEAAAAFLATYKLGGVLLSLSILYGDDSIVHRLRDCSAKVIVTDAANRERIDRVRDELPQLEHVLVVDEEFGRAVARAPDRCETLRTPADQAAQIYYTSGTTGLAKGIVHAHRYLLAHNEFELVHDVRDDEVFHSTGEWAWIAGIIPGILGPWRFGAPIAVFARKGGYDPAQTLYVLEKYKVKNLFATPTALRAMAALGEISDRYPGISLRLACGAGEPLNPEVISWFTRQFEIPVMDFYGLSESYPLCANYPTMEIRPGSMGKPTPGWEIALLDGDEQPVPAGETGEICLRARTNPHYPLGYWNRDEDSRLVFGGDWFHTRDVAREDDDGYVWYEGRNDDVIISAGYRIGPFEVESALIAHPQVIEAAAVASPDELRGHIVKAFVRVLPGTEPTGELAREIQSFVRARLSAYAYPRKIEFVDDLPKTLTGKIRRIELREAETRRARDSSESIM